MPLKIKRIALLLAAVLLALCSCGGGGEAQDGGTTQTASPDFPRTPDRIVIGSGGEAKELLPGDEAFDEIYSAIAGRVGKSGDLGSLRLDEYSRDADGRHMTYALRENETFVELIYEEVTVQSILRSQKGGGVAAEDCEIKRVFCPLTGENHDLVFVSKDDEYKSAHNFGLVTDDTNLIRYVISIFGAEQSESTAISEEK